MKNLYLIDYLLRCALNRANANRNILSYQQFYGNF